MKFGNAVFAAALTIGGSAFVLLPPLLAQPAQAVAAQGAMQAAGRTLNLSREEHVALQALQNAVAGTDRAAQDSALAAARAAAQSADARYGVAYYQLQIALDRQDNQAHAAAVDTLVASNMVPAETLVPLLANQALRAYSANDFQRADRILTRMVELQPSNPVVLADHAQFKARLRDIPGAVALFQRAFAAQEATGHAAPESWYRRAHALAFDNRLAPQAIAFGRQLVSAYPTAINWRDALLSYRALSQPDPALSLDVLRLMRVVGALSGERDHLEFAKALADAGFHGEAKAVLDEGVSSGMLDPAEAIVRQQMTAVTAKAATARSGLSRLRTQALAASSAAPAIAAGDSHYGLGEFAAAAELYQSALQKGAEDPNLVNLRLGMALAREGRRPEAEAAFRSVAGPRADLAAYWLIRLAQPSS